LGLQFNKLGAPYVVVFELNEKNEGIPNFITYNYLYSFCVHFYTELVTNKPVNDAFESTEKFFKISENLKPISKDWDH
jgi:hypothetical protein